MVFFAPPRLSSKFVQIKDNFEIMQSHFFTKLEQSGPDSVQSWTKKFDVSKKKLIFIPINANFHWSMAVWVNPKADNESLNEEEKIAKSYLLHLDSAKGTHNKTHVKNHIELWLQSLFQCATKPNIHICAPAGTFDCSIFSYTSCTIILSILLLICLASDIISFLLLMIILHAVPQQKNGVDCGLFAEKFTEAILNCCSQSPTAFIPTDQFYKKAHYTRTSSVRGWVTNSEAFDFSQKEVTSFRSELLEEMKQYLKNSRN